MPTNEELRNRFDPLWVETPGTVQRTATLHDAYFAMGQLLNDILPEGRSKSIALTELESALLWSEKAVKEWSVPVKKE